MLKKCIKLSYIFITFLYFTAIVNAYEYIDPSNEAGVSGLITEIYDAKQFYDDMTGSSGNEIEINFASSTTYWWPIASNETVTADGKVFATGEPIKTYITSNFGYRDDPFGRGVRFHSGLDIAGGFAPGTVNIIAAKDGVVVYPTKDVSNSCPSSNSLSSCGGGYGNYVIIQHSDGNFTLYGHLHEKSITVTAGESVRQGEVIGKMGSSGNSTGTHLHFEVRQGANAYSATVDPLEYISLENPRSASSSDEEFIEWLDKMEGSSVPIDGYYIIEDIGDGVRSLGHGVTLEGCAKEFAKYGVDVTSLKLGDKIPIEIVDKVELDVVAGKRSYVESILSRNSITLEEHQIHALMSQSYNIGNINGFVDAYERYNNTLEFYYNWLFRAYMPGSKFEKGLTRRRRAEWRMFHCGEYVMDGEVTETC